MAEDEFLHQLMTLPTVAYGILSPDGAWVAFTWYRMHEAMDVFLVPGDGSSAPIPLTHTPEITELVGWASDSSSVIVSEDHSNDELTRLFRVDIAHPGEMIPLTEERPCYYIRGGDLHPSGRYLFYGANFDFGAGEPVDSTWIYRHDLQTGERLPLARPALPAYMQPDMSLDGAQILYARKDRSPAGRQIHLVDWEGHSDREILNFGDQYKVFATWFPDSQRILLFSESTNGKHQGYNSLGVYHWPTQALNWLIDDPRRTIEGFCVSPDGLVIVDEINQARHAPTWIDPAIGVETSFPRPPGNLVPLGCTRSGDWVALSYSATQPHELVRFSSSAKDPQELVSLTRVWDHTRLTPGQLVPAEDFRWASRDGLEIQGWLYRAAPNRHKAVILIHGGPGSHAEDRLNVQAQYLVARGYTCLEVNYRGSTGFGLKFREAIKADGWGGREQEDIASGAEALITRGLAAPGCVGVTGTSYGGYSAWCQITRYPRWLIGAAAPICGMTDLVIDYHTTRPDLRPLSEEMLGGTPEGAPQRYFERSPINFVQDITGGLLIVQGGQDPNVNPENVHEVVKRLQSHGIAYDLLVFEDEGHGIYKPANLEILYRRLADFFDTTLAALA